MDSGSAQPDTNASGVSLIEGICFGIMGILFLVVVILLTKLIQRYREDGWCIKLKNVRTTQRPESVYNRQTALARIELPPDYQAATVLPAGGGIHDFEENRGNQTITSETAENSSKDEPPPSYGTVMKNRFSKHFSWFVTSRRHKNQRTSNKSQADRQQSALEPSAMGEMHV